MKRITSLQKTLCLTAILYGSIVQSGAPQSGLLTNPSSTTTPAQGVQTQVTTAPTSGIITNPSQPAVTTNTVTPPAVITPAPAVTPATPVITPTPAAPAVTPTVTTPQISSAAPVTITAAAPVVISDSNTTPTPTVTPAAPVVTPPTTTPSVTPTGTSKSDTSNDDQITDTTLPATVTSNNHALVIDLDSLKKAGQIDKNAPVLTLKVGQKYSFQGEDGSEFIPRVKHLEKRKQIANLHDTAIKEDSVSTPYRLTYEAERKSLTAEYPYPILYKKKEDKDFTTIGRIRVIA